MLKLVLNSYRSLWRIPSQANINGGFAGYIFFSSLKDGDYHLFFVSIMLMLSTILVVIFPNRITKGMFLCPFTDTQKKQFIKTSITIKTCFLTVIFLIGLVIFYLILRFPPIVILYGTLYFLMFVLILNLQAFGFVLSKAERKPKYFINVNQNYRLSGERILCVCCSVSLIACLMVFFFTENFSLTVTIVHTIVLLINGLLVITYIKKYARYILNVCIDYQAIYTPITKLFSEPGDEDYDFLVDEDDFLDEEDFTESED